MYVVLPNTYILIYIFKKSLRSMKEGMKCRILYARMMLKS